MCIDLYLVSISNFVAATQTPSGKMPKRSDYYTSQTNIALQGGTSVQTALEELS